MKRKASVNVSFARKPVGPLAPNTDSLLPLYAPSPILELFCSNTAIVIAIANTICTIKSVDVIVVLFLLLEVPKCNLGIISAIIPKLY